MSRMFELSSDGRQVDETFTVDRGKSGGSLVVRYVYDIVGSQNAQSTRDPDQPVLKRHSDGSDNASSPQAAPQGQAGQEPDPNQPVLRRRVDGSSP